jgi:uncharacterized protein related to proFAR isomerase
MDIAYEVAQYLDNANFGTLGTDIFVEQIPDNINGIWVVRASGTPQKYIPIENTIVDVYVKDTNSSDAIALIENVKRYIHRMHNTTTTNGYIYSMIVIGDVEAIQRDLEYAKIYKITVMILNRASNLIS